MNDEQQAMRDQIRRNAMTVMTACSMVTVCSVAVHLLAGAIASVEADGRVAVSSGSIGVIAVVSSTALVVAVMTAVVTTVAGLVWVGAGIGRPRRDGVAHGQTTLGWLRGQMQVAQAARSMTDTELDDTITALTDTADRLRAQGRTGEAARVVEDLRVCLSVFRDRQQTGGPTTF